MRRFISLCVVLSRFVFASSAQAAWTFHRLPKPASHSEASLKRWWIERTVRVLRGGEGPTRAEIDQLEPLEKGEIIDRLMNDKRLGDAALAYSLYFLGVPVDTLKKNGTYVAEVGDSPGAIAAAKETLKNGDFLTLLNLKHPYYYVPTTPPQNPKDPLPNATTAELRTHAIQKMLTQLRSVANDLEQGKITQSAAMGNGNDAVFRYSYYSGMGIGLFVVNYADLLFYTYYVVDPKYWPKDFNLAKNYRDAADYYERYLPTLLHFDGTHYHPKDVSEIEVMPFEPQKLQSWTDLQPMLTKLVNSSTNQNRKRAAYILKRYLCDDLTPINVVSPPTHAGGKHASEPACQACHFKLDPMAGFFQDIGWDMVSFAKQDYIVFDDGLLMNKADYSKRWDAIGYVRSSTDPSLNSYGKTLDDLSNILHEAPEARRCVVRRLHEYLVGPDQTIDWGYLEYLTKQFNDMTQAKNSAAAFKATLKTILLSNAYAETDPVADQCYDYPPGVKASALPCKVATILRENCAICHSSTSGPGHLDLGNWIDLGSGRGTFPHLDAQGKQLPAGVTFQRIVDRLSSTDPDARMPLNRHMPDELRKQLYVWANEMGKAP